MLNAVALGVQLIRLLSSLVREYQRTTAVLDFEDRTLMQYKSIVRHCVLNMIVEQTPQLRARKHLGNTTPSN